MSLNKTFPSFLLRHHDKIAVLFASIFVIGRCQLLGLHHPFKVDEGEREMFYLTTHSTHFIYGYMASDIWLRTILIVRKETRYRHIGYSDRLTARVLLYAPSHIQDNTYHGLCYTSRGALAGTRNSSMGRSTRGYQRRNWALPSSLCWAMCSLTY